MFCYDIETVDIESTAIVLSAAITWFDLAEVEYEFSPNAQFREYVERALFVKFNAREQAGMGRTVGKKTLDWWEKQSPEAKKMSLSPSKNDVSAMEGINQIIQYTRTHGDKDSLIWIRGSLDQLCTESLCNSLKLQKGVGEIIHYNRWCDVRTFLRVTKETTDRNGYCTIPFFDKNIVNKHDPIHDIAYDTLMMLRGQ